MKTARILFCFLFAFLLLFLSTKPASAETNLFKPELTWQRSTEAADKVIYEDGIGTKVPEALQLPLDPNQTVFDNGIFTPGINKNAVAPGIEWASWPQHSYQFFPCGPAKELRHLQARFNLQGLDISKVKKVKLISPYYPNDYFPINDNAYIFLTTILSTPEAFNILTPSI